MKIEQVVAKCVKAARDDESLRRVTAYVTPFATVKVTRQHKHDGRIPSQTFVLTIGKANARDQVRLHDLEAAGVPFPVRKLRFDYWPRKVK